MPCAIGIALCSLSTAPAMANGSEAESFFSNGLRLFDKKDYKAAADAFARAFAAKHTEKYLWNLALSEYLAGRFYAALGHFQQYRGEPDSLPAHLARTDDLIERSREHVAHLAIEAPEGFAVSVDEKAVGTAPLSDPVEADPERDHVVRADRDESHLRVEILRPGENTIRVRLQQVAPPAPPLVAQPAPPPAEAPQVFGPVPVSTSSTQTARYVTVIAMGGLALVSAGLGFAFYLAVQNDQQQYEQIHQALAGRATQDKIDPKTICSVEPNRQDCTTINDVIARWGHENALANGFYIAAGGLAALGVVTFFVWPKPRREAAAMAVVPHLDPGSGQVMLEGTF